MFGMLGMFSLLSRNLMFAALLAAAIFGPRLLSQQEGGFSLRESWQKLAGGEQAGDGASFSAPGQRDASFPARASGTAGPATPPAATGAPLAAPAIDARRELLSLHQFLRFDITPAWVQANFDRVSLLRWDQREAMRVALISGTRDHDLAGVLTYYFNTKAMVQRITLDATTGDPTPLTQFLLTHYGLEPQAGRPGVHLKLWNRSPVSGLVVSRAPVLRSGQARTNFEVHVELNRPTEHVRVSPDFEARLNSR